jgi:hypothetical protein
MKRTNDKKIDPKEHSEDQSLKNQNQVQIRDGNPSKKEYLPNLLESTLCHQIFVF